MLLALDMAGPAAAIRSTLIPLLETGGKLYFLALHALLLALGVYCIKSAFHSCGEKKKAEETPCLKKKNSAKFDEPKNNMSESGNKNPSSETNDLLSDHLNSFLKWLCLRKDSIGHLYTCLWFDRLNDQLSEEGVPELKIHGFLEHDFPFTFRTFKFCQTYSGDKSFMATTSNPQDLCLVGQIEKQSKPQNKKLDVCITVRGYCFTVTPCFSFTPFQSPSIVEVEVMPSLVAEEEIDIEIDEGQDEEINITKLRKSLQTVLNQCIILDSKIANQLEKPSEFVKSFEHADSSFTQPMNETDCTTDCCTEDEESTNKKNKSETSCEEKKSLGIKLSFPNGANKGESELISIEVPEINILPATPLQENLSEKTFEYHFASKVSNTSVSMQDVSESNAAFDSDKGRADKTKNTSHDDMDVGLISKRSVAGKILSRSFNYGSKPKPNMLGREGSYLALNPSGGLGSSKTSSLVIESVEDTGTIYYHIPPSMAKKGNIPQKGRKLHIHNDHLFVAKHFKGFPPECAVCSLPLARRLGKQGYQCKDCDTVVHKRCHCMTQDICSKSTLSSLQIEYLGSTDV